jgi:NADPH-dependent ferric siderophore reductase
MTPERHAPTRVRHDPRRRSLTVASLDRLTPRMLRIGFTSPDLHDFSSPSPDDHIKLFFRTVDGATVMRDFTPRAYDNVARTLSIDFVLHDAGPATQWAAGAAIGDTLEIGGPRGSTIVADDFDWYLLIGDETAFPAIARRAESLPADASVVTYAIVARPEEALSFTSPAALTQTWIVRQDGEDDAVALRRALDGFTPPAGDGFVWIAAEGGVARALRQYMSDDRGHRRDWMKAAGYWALGQADGGGKIEDEPGRPL